MIKLARQTEVLKRDKNSRFVKHAREKGHTRVWESDFRILGYNYQSNFKRKIMSLYLEPTLTGKETSIPLHLFNWFFVVIIPRHTSIKYSNYY